MVTTTTIRPVELDNTGSQTRKSLACRCGHQSIPVGCTQRTRLILLRSEGARLAVRSLSSTAGSQAQRHRLCSGTGLVAYCHLQQRNSVQWFFFFFSFVAWDATAFLFPFSFPSLFSTTDCLRLFLFFFLNVVSCKTSNAWMVDDSSDSTLSIHFVQVPILLPFLFLGSSLPNPVLPSDPSAQSLLPRQCSGQSSRFGCFLYHQPDLTFGSTATHDYLFS